MNAWLEASFGVTLLAPWGLLAALLVPLALLVRRRQGEPALRFGPAPLARRLPRTWRTRTALVPRALVAIALLAAAVALARPVSRAPLPMESQGIDIVLALDVSSSMATPDLGGGRTRLSAAKSAAARFVADRRDDRIGLVSFARWPDLRSPPTRDHDALQALLGDVATVPPDSPEDATGIGAAVARATEVLGRAETPSRVVVLLTDGAENVATAARPREIAPLHAAQLAEATGVRVYVIVVAGAAEDAPDTREVESLARRTGGEFHAARGADDVAAVYARIDALERAPLPEPRHRVEERFGAWLGAAVVLLVVGRLYGAARGEPLP